MSLDPLKVPAKYQWELAKFQMFAKSLNAKTADKIDIKAYAKHVLEQGARGDKRELLGLITSELYLENRLFSLFQKPKIPLAL